MTFVVREQKIVDIEYVFKGQKSVESFTLTKFNAELGWEYGKIVQKVLVPVYADLMQSMRTYYKDNPPPVSEDGEEADIGLPIELMPELFKKGSQALAELEDKLVFGMVRDSLSITPAQFNSSFSGKTQVIVKLLIEIIKFNYSDVFIELGLGEM